jgi:hypothetical protein
MSTGQNVSSDSLRAGVAIAQFIFVAQSTTADATAVLPAAGGAVVGISTLDAAAGGDVPVQLLGWQKVTVGASNITRGAIVASDNTGKATTATSGQVGVGIAKESGTAGGLMTIWLQCQGKQ